MGTPLGKCRFVTCVVSCFPFSLISHFSKRRQKQGTMSNEQQLVAPQCNCATPYMMKYGVSKSPKNPNRAFWTCPVGKPEQGGCGAFCWVGQENTIKRGPPRAPQPFTPAQPNQFPGSAPGFNRPIPTYSPVVNPAPFGVPPQQAPPQPFQAAPPLPTPALPLKRTHR